jgi:hypothetical protein
MRRFRPLSEEELHVVPGAAKEGPEQFLAVVFAPLLSTQKGKGNVCKSNHSQLKIQSASWRTAVQDDVLVGGLGEWNTKNAVTLSRGMLPMPLNRLRRVSNLELALGSALT